MARFLLIHGSCHGAWCWRDLLPLMNGNGHSAIAIDLPGSGRDTTPIRDVTLDLYATAIQKAIDQPTILVGHSAGGYPIAAAAMKQPEKVAGLVYLCAYTPQSGKSMVDRRKDALRQPLLDAVIKSDDTLSYHIDPAKVRDKFYHDCGDEIVNFAKANLGAQPIQPQATPLMVTPSLEKIPKSYIRCLQDHAVPPEFQKTMSQDWPADMVYEMDCSHSPFFSQPVKLAEILTKIGDKT